MVAALLFSIFTHRSILTVAVIAVGAYDRTYLLLRLSKPSTVGGGHVGPISDGWLLAALKAQQAPFLCCPTPGRAARGHRGRPHLAPCGGLGQHAAESPGRNPASSQPPPNPDRALPDALQPFSGLLGDLQGSLHKDSPGSLEAARLPRAHV